MPKPRKPTEMKRAAGTLQPCRTNKAEPKPRRALLDPPDDLAPEAAEHWRRLAPICDGMGVLTVADGDAMRGLCETLAEVRSLRRLIAEYGGYTFETMNAAGGRMLRAYPEVAILSDAERRLLEYLRRFGLTPADRSRVSAAPAAPEAASPWGFLSVLPGEGAAAN